MKRTTPAIETWFELRGEHWVFKFSKHHSNPPRMAANACPYFMQDDEDEMVDDELISCLNCVYRRWNSQSFECVKLALLSHQRDSEA
ncbi:hypothetical protein [Shewanella gelidii]|uniref:Uncharacterized protein n=1 Tax=Shewanella gelidii TaxID=1642821 RepID=A0A917NA18_9GAMM|nr:hypothetical protein [Shewanella gelidii]MCL1099142.1 hypothetical protein [Shewanella gelidii]GGI81397.1 hypothetical protein GCM10009332_18440 [Shewanella gelidii]